MSILFKKIITSLILLSFIMIVLFSFASMMHGPDERISGDCPFSAMGVSLCPQNTIAIILHHISSYQSFVNVPVNFGTATFILYSLLIAYIIFVAPINRFLPGLSNFVSIHHDSPPDTSNKRKVIRWLALHENSPAIF